MTDRRMDSPSGGKSSPKRSPTGGKVSGKWRKSLWHMTRLGQRPGIGGAMNMHAAVAPPPLIRLTGIDRRLARTGDLDDAPAPDPLDNTTATHQTPAPDPSDHHLAPPAPQTPQPPTT